MDGDGRSELDRHSIGSERKRERNGCVVGVCERRRGTIRTSNHRRTDLHGDAGRCGVGTCSAGTHSNATTESNATTDSNAAADPDASSHADSTAGRLLAHHFAGHAVG